MSESDRLLPCPMCGGQPDFQHFNVTPNVRGRVICSCGIELRQGANDTEEDIRGRWNTRSDYSVQAGNERKVEQTDGLWPSEDSFAAHLLGVTARQDERIAALEANWNAAKDSANRWRERCIKFESRCYELESLVRDMHRDMHGCWYCHNCGSCDRDECMFEERMRELGVME